MKYGNVNLKVIFGSLSFVVGKEQEIRHYPFTDKSDTNNRGRTATRISCTLKATSIEELILIQSILHSSSKQELHFKYLYYKDVVAGQQGEPQPKTADELIWLVRAEFVALDPIPYSESTGEALY